MDDNMFTNIDDIPDPVLLDLNESNSPNLKQKNDNVSNIEMKMEKINDDIIKSDNKTDIFNEMNILLIFILILAGLPQGNKLIMKIIPHNFQNDIIINIVKALILFLIYYFVSRYV